MLVCKQICLIIRSQLESLKAVVVALLMTLITQTIRLIASSQHPPPPHPIQHQQRKSQPTVNVHILMKL